jgi:nicotinamidase-related amidase
MSDSASQKPYRTHAAPGRGGLGINPSKTCVLFIEMQNEFTTPGGLLHNQVKETIQMTGCIDNAASLAKEVRKLGVKVFHAPITFAKDSSDNPNKHLGILAGCDHDSLFQRGSWNAKICDQMTPQPEDVVIDGKRGLSAFPNTNLEEHLAKHGIETIALGGFMANCCVESTMREACEKGYNVVTLTDCVGTTSVAGYKAAVEITYPFFSTPMNGHSFLANIKEARAEEERRQQPAEEPAAKRRKCVDIGRTDPKDLPKKPWDFYSIAPDIWQVGPWFVDVRHHAIGGRVIRRGGGQELRRYLTFAEASGMMGCAICARSDAIYTAQMPPIGESTEPFGWFCMMTVMRLPDGGCVIYSPILGPDQSIDAVLAGLKERDLLPIRVIVAPSPQHHLALDPFQAKFPDAHFLCGKASGQMPPLTRKRREIKFVGTLGAGKDGGVVLGAAEADAENGKSSEAATQALALLESVAEVAVIDDNRSGEVVLRHKASGTFVCSDLLYKSDPKMVGPGGTKHQYSAPEWFAKGQEELFYTYPGDNSGGLLPAYRTHPRMRSIDIPGMRRSLEQVLAWDFDKALACHVDPMTGDECKGLLRQARQWVWAEEAESNAAVKVEEDLI